MNSTDRSAGVAALVVDDGGRVAHANAAASTLLGRDGPDALLDALDGAHRERFRDQVARVTAGEADALGLTVSLTTPAGDREAVALTSAVEWAGEPRARVRLIATEDALPAGLSARTMDASPVGISIADATADDEPLIYVNEEFCQLTGYPEDEVLGQNCRFLQGPETDPETVATVREAIDAGDPVTVELRNYRKDGSMFWNHVSIAPIRDEGGALTHFLGFQQDVTERRLAAQERTLFEMQADAVEQSVFITDAEGTIVYVNPQFERTTGYTAAEALGRNPRFLRSGEQDEDFYADLWETIRAGDIWEAEVTNRRKSGKRYRTTQKIVPVEGPSGAITNFVAVERDVTDTRLTEQAVDVMNRVLRHNVRNSVNAIDGYADLLAGELESEENRAALQTIREYAGNLEELAERTRLIRDLLERRSREHTLSVAAIEGFVDQRRERHPEATFDFSLDVDDVVEIQNGSLLQVAIDEALENAVVHSDRDHPSVSVSVSHAPDTPEVSIEIADDGPGIPAAEWDVIAAGRETPLAHVSGIGLWLIYWTVTALGGTVTRTDADPGTVLTFRVPVQRSESAPDSRDAE